MAIENKFPDQHTLFISRNSKGDYSKSIPTDRIIEYDLEEFKSERRVYAKRQISSYKKKIDILFALNHPEMRCEYIKRINRLILVERGEIIE